MRKRIFIKLMVAALAVVAAATISLDWSVRRGWERSLRSEIERSLTRQTEQFALHVGSLANNSAQRATLTDLVNHESQASGARATVIDTNGLVLADSEANPTEMENHAHRPEFIAAFAGRIGSDARRSHTLGIEFLYVAAPVPGGAVRLAYPLSAIAETTRQVRTTLLQGSLLALAVAALLALLAASSLARRLRRIMVFAEQVASGQFSSRVDDRAFDEIAQVAAALDRTASRLNETFQALESNRRQLETLLNSMQDAVFAVSRDRRLQWVNGAMRRLLPQIQLRESLLEAVRDPDLLRTFEQAVATESPQSTRATSIAPGRIFQVTAAPMPGGAVIVLHDVTEIERVETTRRDFIANVSHELRTPLTSIQGYTETLLDGSDIPAERREFLEIIRDNATRMSRLCEDLLKLARVESGEWKLELEAVTAAELLRDAAQIPRSLASSSSAQAAPTQIVVEESSAHTVMADRDAIHQVFANLIENATKYAPGARITLGATEHGNQTEFYVRDSGPGIPADHLPRLFERFYRVDKARSREAGGTGLGLAIVKHIVRNHGGEVRVESELNHGSTFYFTLPVALQQVTEPRASLVEP